MKIIYPYNEILPRRLAHDVYVFQNCAGLARSGCSVELLCGRGSWDEKMLARYYLANDPIDGLLVKPLLILRRNFFRFSWNLPFFLRCQQRIKSEKPDIVITSVLKQAAYHHARKIPGVRYVYEAHQLAWYPSLPEAPYEEQIAFEKSVLGRADLITVTTQAMKEILQNPPYSLSNSIQVVPLAVTAEHLKSKETEENRNITLCYVGQLYKKQGIDLMLHSLKEVEGLRFEIVGGSPADVSCYADLVSKLQLHDRVVLHGFHPPAEIARMVQRADVFVAPFLATERMPYVAHTKLLEYSSWRRPVIVPDLPITREHFPEKKGALFFEAGNQTSLVAALKTLKEKGVLERLQSESAAYDGVCSWSHRSKNYLHLLAKVMQLD